MDLFWVFFGAALLVAAMLFPVAIMMNGEGDREERIGTACVKAGGEWVRDGAKMECHHP